MSSRPIDIKHNLNISAIAAMAENRVIGNGSKIPWYLPEDFKWFKATTLNHVIVMGRKTYESIGRPLPKRVNVVLTRQNCSIDGVTVMPNLELLLTSDQFAGRQVFICGGADVYRQALPYCSEIFMTHVKKSYEGDILFPPFENDFRNWELLKDNEAFLVKRYWR